MEQIQTSQLKQLLSLSQLQLNDLAFASDAGKLLGFLSGIAALYLPLWLVLLIGATLGFWGYGIQYLLLTNQISALPYFVVFLLTVVAGNSICWINTVCYIIALQNFPLDQIFAVGLSTSYQGLSAKIYADIVDALVTSSSQVKRAKVYLLLNTILPLIICCICAPLVRRGKTESSRNFSCGFITIFIITLFTGTYAVITSLLKSTLSRFLLPRTILIGLVAFLVAPLGIPMVEKIRESIEKKCLVLIRQELRKQGFDDVDDDVTSFESTEEEEEDIEEVIGMKRELLEGDNVKEEIGVKVMMNRLNFWLYFSVYLFGATLGFVYMNNLGQIAESRGTLKTSSLVSLASSFGFFGRLIPALLDYYTSRTKCHVSRPATIAAMMAPMTAAFFILLDRNSISLYISTATIGFCSGTITSLSISTTTELFGSKHFGVNHNILVTNIPVGSFLFGDLAALLYRKQGWINGDLYGKCIGMKCYQWSFIIWGSLCFLGTFLAFILHYRTRKFYSQRSSKTILTSVHTSV